MYFGDYLVQKKVISYEQLLQALCYQIESMPSMVRIVIENKLIDAKEMLELIKKQAKDDLDILHLLKSEKNISDDKIVELEMKQFAYKIPLGEALVKLNFSSIDVVDKHLKEFYEQKFNLSNSEDKQKAPAVEVEMSEAALESLRELGFDIDGPATNVTVASFEPKPFVDQYLDLFSEKFKKKLLKLIEIIEKEVTTDSDISNYFNSLYRDLHLLKGAVVLSELTSQERFLNAWENKIENLLSKNNDEIRSWCKSHLNILVQSVNLLWDARLQIVVHKSDIVIENDERFMSDIEDLIDKLA
jgi:hypothetical protein